MASLNLRSRDPVPEPDDEITDPETPPGLDAIRAWLGKPRPWLRGLRLWTKWVRSKAQEARRWLRKHGPRIAKRLRRIAAEGTVTRRVLERVGHLLRETAVKVDAAFKAFRDPRGESQGATGELDQLGETFRRLGERVTLGARIVGIVVSVLNRTAGFFPESSPTEPNPKPPEPETSPPKPRPELGPPSPPSGKPGGSPEEPPPQPSGSGPPETQRPPLDAPQTDPPPPDAPGTDPPPPHTLGTHPPGSAATPRPVDWEARLKGLPPVLHRWVRELGQRPRRDTLRALVLQICNLREWTTSEELARFLDMHKPSLVYRHLRPLMDTGALALKYPEEPNHPRQAYRTRPEAAALHM